MEPDPPAAGAVAVEGSRPTLHMSVEPASCVKVKVLPAIVTLPERTLVVVFGAIAMSTLALPAADALSRMTAHGTDEVAVQGQLETFVVTPTVPAIRFVPVFS